MYGPLKRNYGVRHRHSTPSQTANWCVILARLQPLVYASPLSDYLHFLGCLAAERISGGGHGTGGKGATYYGLRLHADVSDHTADGFHYDRSVNCMATRFVHQ